MGSRYANGKPKLNEADLIAFAKGEYAFDLASTDAKKILKQVGGGKGITIEKFKICRSRIGAVHSAHRHKAKQSVELDQKKQALDELNARVEAARNALTECKALVAALSNVRKEDRDDTPFKAASDAVAAALKSVVEICIDARKQASSIKSTSSEFNNLRNQFSAMPKSCEEITQILKQGAGGLQEGQRRVPPQVEVHQGRARGPGRRFGQKVERHP